MLALEGAIVTIDAMGTQKAIAANSSRKGPITLALKENQSELYPDVEEFFADPALASACEPYRDADAGHGRIEEGCVLATKADWLAKRHPRWKGLCSSVAITCLRTDKKTDAVSKEQAFASRPCRPIQNGSSPRAAPIGASRTICTGRSM